jgi:hypothetical protein
MSFKGNIVPTLPAAGIDTSQGAQNIEQDACSDVRNVRFFKGDLQQRQGYSRYIDTVIAAAPVTGICQMQFTTAVTRFIAAAGTALVKDGGAGAWTSIKGALTLTSGAGNLFAFARLNDKIIGTNGVDQLWKYSDATDPAVVLGGTPPQKALGIMDFQNRILLINITTSGGTAANARIMWCAINNPDDWVGTGSGFAEPILASGQTGIGLGKTGNEAFAFFSLSIFRILPTGDSNVPFRFVIHETGVGATSQQSIVTIPNIGTIFFCGPRGIYQMESPSYRPVRISKPLDGIWDSVNKTRLSKVVAAVFSIKNEVWFSVTYGSGSTNNMILVYDYERKAWTVFDGILANYLMDYLDGSGIPQIAHGDYNGRVQKNESGATDDGTAITAYITSKAYPVVDGTRRGRVAFIEVCLDAQSAGSRLQINWGFDLGGVSQSAVVSQDTTGSVWDTGVWDTSAWAYEQEIIVRQNVTGQGRFFQYQIKNDVSGNTFRVYRVALGVISEKRIEA